jgi:hypothetical protein
MRKNQGQGGSGGDRVEGLGNFDPSKQPLKAKTKERLITEYPIIFCKALAKRA